MINPRWSLLGQGPEIRALRAGPLGPHHAGPPVVTPRFIEVDGEVVQGPDEREVHGGVMGGVALEGQIVPQVDVSTGWS